MKWLLLAVWLSSMLYYQARGRVKAPMKKFFFDHSVLLAPINSVMILFSRVPTTPYISVNEFPELKPILENWQVFRKDALRLEEMQRISAATGHNDIGFNSFFKYGWKRFYLKWYNTQPQSALDLCPDSVRLLKAIPSVKAAMFAELPPGGKLNAHRDPYAGSLRFHMGLMTPNHDDCWIQVDGEKYSWRDGEATIFDETYIHQAKNDTDRTRIILFCDIERPVRFRVVQAINRWFSRLVMSAAASPNDASDRTGAINKIAHIQWRVEQKRKALKARSKTLYRVVKLGLVALIVGLFVYL